ncbi:ferredoxin [Synechococcus sp. NOUM97013]|uniref:(2Fe-2S) ferredoxin domain-containing protein n=1 Tax=Synechococcus sp. NOUM97013 TaxID=1442555 RepID=UPI0016496049|nr:(2Fe-2S) ferredoxin domain-containing protein [Synechococcus sp. NOUM97013]
MLLCATPTKAKCCDPADGLETWNALKRLVRDLGLENEQRPQGIVLRSKVDCLRACERGPILVIWPEGIWYSDVTPERIEVIIRSHIINNQPIEKWIYKTTPFQHQKHQST